jgi:two-component system nitrogen regulation sensor histidine kinase NtrY
MILELMSARPDSAPEDAVRPQDRRRWWEAGVMAVTTVAVLSYALFEARLPQVGDTNGFGTDAMLVLLININLILLVLLVFLVGRHLFKLVLDRRRGVLGSHLRTRLVVAFVAIALLPATLMFIVAQTFTTNSIDRWFNREVERAIKGSLDVANAYYQGVAATSLGFATRIAQQVADEPALLERGNKGRLKTTITARRMEYQLDLVEVFTGGRRRARSRNPAVSRGIGTSWSKVVQDAAMGTSGTVVDTLVNRDVVRAAVPIVRDQSNIGAVVVAIRVPARVVRERESISRSFSEYLSLKIQRRPIRTAYTITLVLATLVVVFAAIWVGFYVSRGITQPIERLAEGTRVVAQGDLDHRIAGGGDDEIGTLVRGFNSMTRELKAGRMEREERRRYLEIVLANVTAGVISTDAPGTVTTVNPAALVMLGAPADALLGHGLLEALATLGHEPLRELVAELQPEAAATARTEPVEGHVTVQRRGGVVTLFVTGTRLVDGDGTLQGLVVFLEDVTQLLRIERMEAWREVARRIAHEIKNPLTPIQLSAQRLRRRFGPRLRDEGTVFDDCTRTIIQEVETLKTLVNEFATFARMPAAPHVLQDVHPMIDEAVVLFREAHPDVRFSVTRGPDVPDVEIDRSGMKRALVNVLDNAVAAVQALPADEPRHIDVTTSHDRDFGVLRIEISDNGPGVAADVRDRVFEPYVSTKTEGTGLGLAIVSAILADHKGFVRLRENLPRGSRFVLEIPVRSVTTPQLGRGSQRAYGTA